MSERKRPATNEDLPRLTAKADEIKEKRSRLESNIAKLKAMEPLVKANGGPVDKKLYEKVMFEVDKTDGDLFWKGTDVDQEIALAPFHTLAQEIEKEVEEMNAELEDNNSD